MNRVIPQINPRRDFVYQARRTRMGRYFVEVLYNDVVIATGRHTHESAEKAVSEMLSAVETMSLRNVIEPNGKLLELIP